MDPGSGSALSAAQRSKIRRLAAPGEQGPEEEGGEINVVPFLDILTNVLMFVLATLAITFTATIDTREGRPGRTPPGTPQSLGLTVIVVQDGFSVKARGGNVATGCEVAGAGLAVPRRDGAFDYGALKACVSKLKASSPAFADESGVTITANPGIPYDVLVATMDAVRTSERGDDLFPEVSLAVAR